MAERYKRYESKGLRTNLPTLSFAADKALSQGYSQIGSLLDQMSSIFNKRATDTAKIEGAEYGALNAPTKQQILDAQSSGTDIALPGDKTTVFGKAARNSALLIASDNITHQAKVKISEIILNAKINKTDPREVGLQLDSLVDGFASSIEQDSPATSKKLRASIGIYANAEYKSYTSSFITDAQKEILSIFEKKFQNMKDIEIPKYIETGLTTKTENEDGQEVAVTRDLIKNATRNLLASIPPGTSRSDIEDIANDFDKRVFEVSQNILYNEILKSKNTSSVYQKLLDGKIKELPLAVQNAWSVVEGQNKRKLLEMAFKAVNDKFQMEQNVIKNNDTKRKENIRIVNHNAAKALLLTIDSNTKTQGLDDYKKQINIMKTLDATKAKEMQDNLDANLDFKYVSVSNSQTLENIEIKLLNADTDLTMAFLNTELTKQRLSFSDFKNYVEKLETRLDKDFNEALKFVRSKLNIPLFNMPGFDKNGQRMKKLNAMTEAMMIERRKNPDEFRAKQFVEENFDLIVGNLNKDQGEGLKKELEDGGYQNLEGLKDKVRSNPKSIIPKILLEKINLWNKENTNKKIN